MDFYQIDDIFLLKGAWYYSLEIHVRKLLNIVIKHTLRASHIPQQPLSSGTIWIHDRQFVYYSSFSRFCFVVSWVQFYPHLQCEYIWITCDI